MIPDIRLPGSVRAVVSRDVRSFDGSRILIPRGFKYWFESVGDEELEILQVDAALNFRLDDVVVDGIAQVGVGWKEPRMVASGVHGRPLRA